MRIRVASTATSSRRRTLSALLAAALAITSCESDSPIAPSGQLVLSGTVSNGSAGVAYADVDVLAGPAEGLHATADTDGHYELSLRTEGTLSVRASATGYEPQTAIIHLNGSATLDFDLSRRSDSAGLDDLVTVTGVVRDADRDTPVPGADVAITGGPETGRASSTDGDGRFVLDHLRPGPLSIRVAAPGYRPVTRELVAGEVHRLNVGLQRGSSADADYASVSGVVSEVLAPSLEHAPVEGAQVTIVTGSSPDRSTRTDQRGRYLLEPLGSGPATLRVSAPTFETMTTTVTLRPGPTTVDIVLDDVEAVFTTRGHVVDVLTQAAMPNVLISGIELTAETTDTTGAFEVGARSGSAAPRLVELTSPDIVSRRAYIRVPDVETEISVIPAGFNLTAFDEMLRRDVLRRWRTAPPLIIERQAIELSNVDMAEGTALDDSMSDDELHSLLTDLRWALPLLTGDTFSGFARVTARATAPGTMSTLLTDGSITVVRVEGLMATTASWGWSRWLYQPDGTVTGGVMLLDLEFDRSASLFRRTLRAHELGHTLGYTHVISDASVMNANARLEPTEFDRDATRIAFARFPGNMAPDVEPDPRVQPSRRANPTWSQPVR